MRLALASLLLLAACGTITHERAAQQCEKRAQAAMGPQGNVTVGVNSQSGGFTSGNITFSSDYLAGRDPYEVYRTCVIDMTGQEPYRPPVLY
jgi:outer membrane lipoprotein-sorting protein